MYFCTCEDKRFLNIFPAPHLLMVSLRIHTHTHTHTLPTFLYYNNEKCLTGTFLSDGTNLNQSTETDTFNDVQIRRSTETSQSMKDHKTSLMTQSLGKKNQNYSEIYRILPAKSS